MILQTLRPLGYQKVWRRGSCIGTEPASLKPKMIDNTPAEAKRHNSALPIHRLVPELFIESLLYDTDPMTSDIPRYYVRIRNIALVSTTWAEFVFKSPMLWRYIHWGQSQNDLLNSLRRSKGCPLVIEYKNVRKEELLVPFVDVACQEIHRWQRADIEISDPWTPSSELLLSCLGGSSAPLLKELQLSYESTPPYRPFSPFSQRVEGLRALSFQYVPIDWASPRLTKLESLVLCGDSEISPSASQLAQVLRACPGLVCLEIHYNPSATDPVPINRSTLPTDTTPIELPALTAFYMHVNLAVATYILEVVRIPACEKFTIEVRGPHNTFLSDALRHHTSVLASRVASAPSIDIHVADPFLRYEASEISICLMPLEARPEDLTWIINHIHPLSVPTSLIITSPHFPTSALEVPSLACSVTRLDPYDNRNIFHYLSQPVTVEGARRFPLPNLRELRLDSFTELEPQDFIPLVECRLGGIGACSESEWERLQREDWPELPARFSILHLPSAYRSRKTKIAVRKLKKLVDTLVFDWSHIRDVEDWELPGYSDGESVGYYGDDEEFF
ncbi:hypothetical protein FRB96_002155 [Tulasnella sp. 330]|nr:hypothetical protein FRB96_002155 [Tulasnella sp. 330]